MLNYQRVTSWLTPTKVYPRRPWRCLNQELAPEEPHHVRVAPRSVHPACTSNSRNLVKLPKGWWCNNHLEKWWSSSMGRMTSHMKWKNKIHVPNHQPDIDDLPEVDRIWENIEVSMWFLWGSWGFVEMSVFYLLQDDVLCIPASRWKLQPPMTLPQIDCKTLVADYPGGAESWNFPSPQWIKKVRGVVTVIWVNYPLVMSK